MTDTVLLPGILLPGAIRYAPLLSHLDAGSAVVKELEVYAGAEPPADYSVAHEVAGLDRFADEQGLDRFHLLGHSAGGAVALAYVAANPDRVRSLALDEAASDFTAADRELLADQLVADFFELPPAERMAAFVSTLVRPGVALTPPPAAAPAEDMAKRPAGVSAFGAALTRHRIDEGAYASYDGPVYFSYGSLSNQRWEAMAGRMPSLFRRCTVERYDGLHHMNTSHLAEPGRVAAALRVLWDSAG